MSAETIGGHIVRSLEQEIDSLLDAQKKGKDAMDKAADNTLLTLDSLISLLGDDAPEDEIELRHCVDCGRPLDSGELGDICEDCHWLRHGRRENDAP